MPRQFAIYAVATLLFSAALITGALRGATQPQPRLVVLVVVDQLTPEQLDRYDDAWTGGLRRLLDAGAVFTAAAHDHAITFTAPGHATLGTGVHPARHGLVHNSWRTPDGDDWRVVDAVADADATIVGTAAADTSAGDAAGSSPHNLLRGGLADWLLAADPAARVVSVAGKPTAAIPLAGRARGYVYWYSGAAGRFVTSSWYRVADPVWVEQLDRRALAAEELDAATLAFAKAAIAGLELGRRGATDFLAIGLSQTDRVGHAHGPWSSEQYDNLLRVDRALGDFLDFLDGTLGRDGYVLALSSDHGVLPMPERLQSLGEPGRRVGAELADAVLAARRMRAAAPAHGTAAAGHASAAHIAAHFEALDFVAQVIPRSALAGTEPADSFTEMYRRSYLPGRETARMAEFDVELRLAWGALTPSRQTTHGSPYLYDRRVPLIFFGAGIAAGMHDERAGAVDVAPTLAALAGVAVPADLDGRALLGTPGGRAATPRRR